MKQNWFDIDNFNPKRFVGRFGLKRQVVLAMTENAQAEIRVVLFWQLPRQVFGCLGQVQY